MLTEIKRVPALTTVGNKYIYKVRGKFIVNIYIYIFEMLNPYRLNIVSQDLFHLA